MHFYGLQQIIVLNAYAVRTFLKFSDESSTSKGTHSVPKAIPLIFRVFGRYDNS
jgi:hypothetical protein